MQRSQALASPVIFAASGAFAGGGTLGGTVTIDTATGTVLAADLSAVVPQLFTSSYDAGGIPNYANSGFFVIAANHTSGGYPVALIGIAAPGLIGYMGGPISTASGLHLAGGTVFTLSSARPPFPNRPHWLASGWLAA